MATPDQTVADARALVATRETETRARREELVSASENAQRARSAFDADLAKKEAFLAAQALEDRATRLLAAAEAREAEARAAHEKLVRDGARKALAAAKARVKAAPTRLLPLLRKLDALDAAVAKLLEGAVADAIVESEKAMDDVVALEGVLHPPVSASTEGIAPLTMAGARDSARVFLWSSRAAAGRSSIASGWLDASGPPPYADPMGRDRWGERMRDLGLGQPAPKASTPAVESAPEEKDVSP